MILIPRNWADFQHYKERSPPWIKLHKKLLDNYEFQKLPVASRALAPMLWLLASDHEGGEIDAAPGKLAFRLRMTEREVTDAVKPLIENGFFDVVSGDSGMLAGRKRHADPETEERQRREEEKRARDFETFWAAFPRKDGRKKALEAWTKVGEPIEDLLAAIERQRKTENWLKSGGQFIPMPATWLNGERWRDGGATVAPTTPQGPDPALKKIEEDAKRAAPMPAHIRQQIAIVTRKSA